MGFAASQARLLMLHARKSDQELRAQLVSNRRLNLAYESSTIAKLYADKIADRIVVVRTGPGANDEVAINPVNLSMVNLQALYADGSPVPVGITPQELEQGLRMGTIHLDYIVTPEGQLDTNQVDWRQCTALNDRLYTENDEEAAAQYEFESTRIEGEDKKLELELKQIDTEHKAIETEIESVKKVIDKNIEKSFKTFA